MIFEKLAKHWNPVIGDPSPVGWFTVVAYFLAATLLVYHLWRSPSLYRQDLRRHAGILTVCILVLGFLGVNKQLDLQTLMTNIGRDVATEQGWYEGREKVQYLFIGLLFLFSAFAFVGTTIYFRRILKDHWLLLFGLSLLVLFVLVRASSAHIMDVFIDIRVAGIKMNWILELGGISIVSLGSATSILRRNRRSEISGLGAG